MGLLGLTQNAVGHRVPIRWNNEKRYLVSNCRLFEVVETLGRVHLVTEWIQGGELYNRITQDGPLKEIYAASLFKQLLLAVQHMVGIICLLSSSSTSLHSPHCVFCRLWMLVPLFNFNRFIYAICSVLPFIYY